MCRFSSSSCTQVILYIAITVIIRRFHELSKTWTPLLDFGAIPWKLQHMHAAWIGICGVRVSFTFFFQLPRGGSHHGSLERSAMLLGKICILRNSCASGNLMKGGLISSVCGHWQLSTYVVWINYRTCVVDMTLGPVARVKSWMFRSWMPRGSLHPHNCCEINGTISVCVWSLVIN